ncbi:MAG: C-terminal binding protein [Chloroflexi bacterium]|nr:C-terminal binding protein [Chloroflexota bacterium]
MLSTPQYNVPAMDVLERWRPDGWRRPGRVAVANRQPLEPTSETYVALVEGGADVVVTPLRGDGGRVSDAIADADVVIAGGAALDSEVFDQFRRARFLLRPYVGYDDIDVDAATERGILMANVPDTFVEEVANHTLALLLAANRKLLQVDRFVRAGAWAGGEGTREAARPIRRLSTLTLGLVGFGNIARLVAARAAPFGFRMLAHDPYLGPEAAAGTGVTLVGMEELLRSSDIVSIHVFLSPQTRKLINAEQLALMKPEAYLVNTARGPVVDEAALIAALQAGRLAGAALDVFEEEPLAVDSPLIGMENVVLAPHLASYSEEGDHLHRLRIAEIALQVARGGLPERKVVVNKDLYDRLAELSELADVPRA